MAPPERGRGWPDRPVHDHGEHTFRNVLKSERVDLSVYGCNRDSSKSWHTPINNGKREAPWMHADNEYEQGGKWKSLRGKYQGVSIVRWDQGAPGGWNRPSVLTEGGL